MKQSMHIAAKLNGRKRSPHWGSVRAKFLAGKACGICGGTKRLEAHHIRPFHLNPELELDPRNLFPLCEGNKNVQCHLIFGHFGNFRTKYNLAIRENALAWYANLHATRIHDTK